MTRSLPLEIAQVDTAPPHPGSGEDHVRVVVQIRPAPPQDERWWWMRELSAQDIHVVGGMQSDAFLEVQFDTERSRLGESVRLLRDSLAAANTAYPARYASDAVEAEELRKAEWTRQEALTAADRRVIDDALGD